MKRLVPNDAILIPPQAKCVFQGRMFDVYQWPQTLFDGTTETYEMLRRPDTAQMICIRDDKLIVLNEEQSGRPAFLRFPGGRVEPGESWEAAATREGKEELGLSFAQWHLIEVIQPFTKLDWFVATLLATEVTEVEKPQPEGGERIEVLYLSFEEVKKRLAEERNPLLSHAKHLFDRVNSLDELQALPEFQGKVVDRP